MHRRPSWSAAASMGSRIAVSMSVAVIEEPFFFTSRRKWLSMGIVLRFSTMFWMLASRSTSSCLAILSFISPESSSERGHYGAIFPLSLSIMRPKDSSSVRFFSICLQA